MSNLIALVYDKGKRAGGRLVLIGTCACLGASGKAAGREILPERVVYDGFEDLVSSASEVGRVFE